MVDRTNDFDLEQLLQRARTGGEHALGELLERYRPYLTLLARLKANRQLQARLDDSDVVQDTFLSAYRDFPQFRGATEAEFTTWLRQIMAHVIANHFRDNRRQQRDVRLERKLYNTLNQSSETLERALVDPIATPSQNAARRERAVLLANALGKLPADYREVIMLRELEGKSLAEVAQQMDRSVNAVQKLWARSLIQLRRQLEAEFELS